MNMNSMAVDPTAYWVFWWIFTLVVYAGFAVWWKKEIKAVDKKNEEKFELLKKNREEQCSNFKE